MNPFTRRHQPSVFSEAINDPNMDIRSNRELFENVIKNAVRELRDADESKRAAYKTMTEEQKMD